MRRSTTFTLVLLATLLVLSASLGSASAADYTKVGVKIGDNSTYSFTLVNATFNAQGSANIRVKDVTGTLVTLNFTYYNPGGSVNTTYLMGPNNISTGQGGIGFFLICANLSAHDPVNITPSAPTINETINMDAAGATRTVNHLNITLGGTRFNVWWDKPTGLMVKLTAIGPSLPGLGNFTMTSTSLWSPGGGPVGLPDTTLILVAVGVGVVVIVVAVYFIRFRHK